MKHHFYGMYITRGFFSSNLFFQKLCIAGAKICFAAAGDDCGKKLICLKRLGSCLHRRRPGKPGDSALQSDEFGAGHAEFVDILEDEEMEDARKFLVSGFVVSLLSVRL